MVIVGYQGIGKSTLAKTKNGFIDLESSNFFIDGKRSTDWYIPYCKIALNLSAQGYNVFVSSHEVVRTYLADHHTQELAVVCPSKDLRDEWIEKLARRYQTTNLDKDFKAWKNAVVRYDENIDELLNQYGFDYCVIIDSMNYDLCHLLSGLKEN